MSKLRKAVAILFLCTWALPALTADLHVYLNSTGGGSQLNDCPNPLHNTKGVAGNTDELTYCTTSTPHKFICDAGGGCKSWTTTTAACGAGNVGQVTNGVTVDVDGDGTAEEVYGGPMACVWNMGRSDSCEIHAGVYAPGARAGASTVLSAPCARNECFNSDFVLLGKGPRLGLTTPGTGYGLRGAPAYVGGARMNSSTDTWDADGDLIPDCDRRSGSRSCWGTCTDSSPTPGSGNPGQVCKLDAECVGTGATCSLLTSEPDAYPAILDGQADAFPMTICDTSGSNPATCNGGAFYSYIYGCGPGTGDGTICSSTADGHKALYFDVNADGTFDPSTEELGPKGIFNSSWVTVMDLELRKHNGGSACTGSTGTRDYQGTISMMGAPSGTGGEGYVTDHIFDHDDLYTGQGLCDSEDNTALLGDNINHNTAEFGVFRDSLVIVGNKFFFNDDGGEYEMVGGNKRIYGNHFIFPPRVKQPDGSLTSQPQTFARFKGIDAVWTNGTNSTIAPNVIAIYNNLFTLQGINNSTGYPSRMFANETMGRSWHAASTASQGGPRCPELPAPGVACTTAGTPCGTGGAYQCGGFWTQGLGQLWFHGNIIRNQGNFSTQWGRMAGTFCDIDRGPVICPGCEGPGASIAPRMHWYNFSNTIDLGQASAGDAASTWGPLCEGSGTPQQIETFVSRNNAFYKVNTTSSDPTYTASSCVITAGRKCASNNVCTSSSQTGCTTNGGARSVWWNAAVKNAATFSAVANYTPVLAGPLDGTGSCDPDGDGVRGVDWDHDGTNDTSWRDIAGKLVDCSGTNVMDIGAAQRLDDAGGGAVCGNGVAETGENCDSPDFRGANCSTYGFTGGTLTCTSCATIGTANCTGGGATSATTVHGTIRGGRIGP